MITLERSELQAMLEQAAERGALRALGAVKQPKRYISGRKAAELMELSYYQFKRLHVETNNVWPVRGSLFDRRDLERLKLQTER
ncbi:hypothetical protein QEH52_01630 [Coraliomargarita sp. SDUM461003]|uniref:Helix-turn-helix domain-containing protein n=1 Tax=Thalassobacterium maritimum TaxID=3041265 RepID=A0ABU1ARE8_9BACT|nr:hypothetical protein [Coraliomargarita sp. SDUM461003]MDQ8206192.1 hypothetical protein [Coraliomargarita sp. SDUM461003]